MDGSENVYFDAFSWHFLFVFLIVSTLLLLLLRLNYKLLAQCFRFCFPLAF